ncbi:hypothetical protein [Nocardioides sp. InS609-2]|uniref:hypothetical protein n=1 Tax=Nocardioides sp. InS609-2 TaxID=2760705 RepID=UPI0020C15AA0|nr:hypothetical protein [Nocardioides sp. InS609-2]
MNRRLRASALVAASLLLLAGCGGNAEDAHTAHSGAEQSASPEPAAEPASAGHDSHGGTTTAQAAKPRPLRAGERRVTLEMPAAYTPSAPTGVGTDDYRCFLLDPGLEKDAIITGTNVLPGNPQVVHHVILFRVPADQVGVAEDMDAGTPGEGWTCFGGTGLDAGGAQLDNAPWLGAWAPGGSEAVTKPGFGVPLEKGSRVVMQVHYNLLAGSEPDTSATQLRLAPGNADLATLSTFLLPSPVELPCRPGHTDNPMCDRDAALADVKARFGHGPGALADLLHLLCGTKTVAGETQSCTRTVGEPMTIHGVAGHMHLLGREIKIEINPDTPQAQTVLDIPVWDFDNQGAKPIDPVKVEPWDNVRVTCRHSQDLRDKLPSFEGQPDRYVVWGEGTTDEMCLGMLQVTRP